MTPTNDHSNDIVPDDVADQDYLCGLFADAINERKISTFVILSALTRLFVMVYKADLAKIATPEDFAEASKEILIKAIHREVKLER